MKTRRKIKVLVLIEVAAQEGVETGFREDMGGPVLIMGTGAEPWAPDYIVAELSERLEACYPKAKYPMHLWYVKSVKQAVAP